ncbi:MAG: alanine--tRNA ligase [Mycobacteriales bacterium]|nr:MAG: alanine--tRNA ligase [Pseudonocardiales bacterium]
MRSDEIRTRFVSYFQSRGHLAAPSASLIYDDPTLLFVNAGMVPMKPYLLGQETPPAPRMTSVQKVLRTEDIDEVGLTTRHNTFFQMAGNFSFGDYFKEEAIAFAWDLITRPQGDGGYGFDGDRIWATAYYDDDEAVDLWKKVAGLPDERIQRRGMADNYWSMGVPGPCGPNSEIYFDRGPEYGPDGGPIVDEDRFLEIWNLVFMQELRGPGGAKDDYPLLGALPQKNIDTGLGMERVAFLLQGVDNVYETDLLWPTIELTESMTGRRYGTDLDDDRRFRVIADHVRSATMVIADGVTPSNEGRGYVLRRLLRRVIRAVRLLGCADPVMRQLVGAARDAMGPSYPELVTEFERIAGYAETEEEAFGHTIRAGTTIFEGAVRQAKSSGSTTLSGDEAFTLHDTYGFPFELTMEMAADEGLAVDRAAFATLMAEQQRRAKADAMERRTGPADVSTLRSVLDAHGESTFTGYTDAATESTVVALLTNGSNVVSAPAGTEVDVVLDATPFYPESGGQQADHGTLRAPGAVLDVVDVQRPLTGLIVHRARVTEGELRVGDVVDAAIDPVRRRAISRAHTATHLLHRALRGTLGESARQAGSLNSPGRLRFDFTTPASVPASALADVEAEVNAGIADDLPVGAFVTDLDSARALGAMALFGEKYPPRVRVVEIGGEYSRELCGGTHALGAGQLRLVKLVSDSSIGSGVRRVEALVGADALGFLAREHALVAALSEAVKAPAEELSDRVHGLIERLRVAEKELAAVRAQAAVAGAAQLAASARDVFGVAFVADRAPAGVGAADLRGLAGEVRGRLGTDRPAVVVLLSDGDGDRVSFVAATNETARAWGISASDIVGALAPSIGGRGGGRADLAQGGGSDPAGIDAALRAAEHYVGERVTSTR